MMLLPSAHRKTRVPEWARWLLGLRLAAIAGPLKGSRVAARPVGVRFLAGDTAVVVSEDGIIFPGQDAVASECLVRATWMLVRRDGGWRIASYHNSPAS